MKLFPAKRNSDAIQLDKILKSFGGAAAIQARPNSRDEDKVAQHETEGCHL